MERRYISQCVSSILNYLHFKKVYSENDLFKLAPAILVKCTFLKVFRHWSLAALVKIYFERGTFTRILRTNLDVWFSKEFFLLNYMNGLGGGSCGPIFGRLQFLQWSKVHWYGMLIDKRIVYRCLLTPSSEEYAAYSVSVSAVDILFASNISKIKQASLGQRVRYCQEVGIN